MSMNARIETIGEVSRVGKSGQLEQQMEIVFHVGDDGPFRIIQPSSSFSHTKAIAAMEERVSEIRLLRELEQGQ